MVGYPVRAVRINLSGALSALVIPVVAHVVLDHDESVALAAAVCWVHLLRWFWLRFLLPLESKVTLSRSFLKSLENGLLRAPLRILALKRQVASFVRTLFAFDSLLLFFLLLLS